MGILQECKYNVCPKCGHDWIAHFAMVDMDGKQVDPYAVECIECSGSLCTFAIELSK